MAKGQQRSNKETKKPKAAAKPSVSMPKGQSEPIKAPKKA